MRIIAVVVAVALSSGSAAAQSQALRTEKHGAWTMNCNRDRISDAVTCSVFARVHGPSAVLPLVLVIGRKDRSPELIVSSSTAVLASGALRVGQLAAETFRECSRGSCTLPGGRSAAVIAAMESHPDATIYVRAINRVGPAAEGEAALEGFTTAMGALRKALSDLK